MSKNKKILIGLSVLVALILAYIGGNVLAKYQSQAKGDGIANVAKWSFNVNGYGPTIQTIAINQNYNEDTLINGRIGPGTEGDFDIILNATGSEVGIEYNVEFLNEQNKPKNLKFRYNGEEFNTLEELAAKLTGTIDANDSDKIKFLNITWFWDYETGNTSEISQNDLLDTNDGTDAFDYTFDVVVTGTQVAPQS